MNAPCMPHRRTLLTGIMLALLLAAAVPVGAETIVTESLNTVVRGGAGNYYDVVTTVPKGTRLEVVGEADGWYKVKLADKTTGFVSKISLVKKKQKAAGGRQYDIGEERGVGKVAAPVIIAATKGVAEMGPFAKRYAQKHNIDPQALQKASERPFGAQEFAEFKAKLPRKGKPQGPALSSEGMGGYDQEVGAAIALRLASEGISRNEKLKKYVWLVGTAALESTPLYDQSFAFIVLDSPKIQSFATPGGYVFITTGAIAQMKNEAEVAGVLSHEIVHVVQRHGIRELERQKTRLQSQQMMGTLDDEIKVLDMDKANEELMADLDDMADQMFEALISGRKQEDEDESDRLGTAVLYNTGYIAGGLKSFLIEIDGKVDEAKKGSVYSHKQTKDRVASIDNVIKTNGLTAKDRISLEERFNKNAK